MATSSFNGYWLNGYWLSCPAAGNHMTNCPMLQEQPKRQNVSDAAWEAVVKTMPWADREIYERAYAAEGTVLLTVAEHEADQQKIAELLNAHETMGKEIAALRAEIARRYEGVRAPYSTMPPIKGKPWDFAGKLRQGLQEIRDGLYEHGLKGPQATSYTEAQREHAEPVVDAVEALLDELLKEFNATEEVQTSKTDGHGSEQERVAAGGVLADAPVPGAMGRQALLRSMGLSSGIDVHNPRLGNRYTGG